MKEFVFVREVPPSNNVLELYDVGHITTTNFDQSTILFIRINREVTVSSQYVEKFDIHRTGDRYRHKVCDRCFKRLDTDMFSDNRIKKNDIKTKRPSCKSCRKIKDGKNISKNDRETWEKKKPKDFSLFKCPICNKTTIVGLSNIVLDHCHKTGQVRGYLCESCNTGIGRFDDDPNLVNRASEWLKGML